MIKTADTFSIGMKNPYPSYTYMQEHSPVHQLPSGQWIIFDYKNAHELLQSPKCLHWGQDERVFGNLPPMEKAIATTLYTLSPGSDRPYRKQILHQLAGRSLKIDEKSMQDLADDLLINLKGKNNIDIISDFAHPFTFGTICRIIGIPENQRETFSNLVAKMDGGYLSCIDIETGKQTIEGAAFIQQLKELIKLKQNELGNDLCSVLLESSHQEPDQEAFLISMLILLFYAGHQNMMNFFGNALLTLHEHPKMQQEFREHPKLLDKGVDELIRYDSPLQYIMLIAKEDIKIDDKHISAGSQLLISVGAANRDASVFENPEQLILDREHKHLGYGVGAFRCIGARLAQLQASTGLNSWLKHVVAYNPKLDEVSWRMHPFVQRGPASVPVKIDWNDDN
ncbi:cytochrome P450 [Kordia sp. YSTF-M3]|uniref:Cytochrome P450 n=1 Tax=Kordia aestuariivivens TaxID=2759037 RepID=A0ABR7QEP9_9FLAO|nr:cytochrome P450 [Kordia aestuariivivens]MBC8757040.1 cytochrome P450 [Kordia aestuariivivens]